MRKPPANLTRSYYAVEVNPWSRRGDIEAAQLFRGTIVSAYGHVETELSKLCIQISRLDNYAQLVPILPYRMSSRIEFLRRAFAYGPLKAFGSTTERFLQKFEGMANLRHLMAHSRMDVQPDWGVTFEDYRIIDGAITHRYERFLIKDLEEMARRSARFARLGQKLKNELMIQDILPQI